jgi:hypothetical protein
MSDLSIWHWLVILIVGLFLWAFAAIFGRILHRAGYSRWWMLTILVPIVNVIMVWIFAFAQWPVLSKRQ